MGREIKFRAWNKKTKCWHNEHSETGLTYKDFHIFGECTMICTPRCGDLQHLQITQYTGLKDKNGQEIYEGDIVKSKYDKCVVSWGESGWIPFEYSGGGEMYDDYCKVIGNIYQNPELA